MSLVLSIGVETSFGPPMFVVKVIGKRTRFLRIRDTISMDVVHAIKIWG